jgi:HEAT repeat protein
MLLGSLGKEAYGGIAALEAALHDEHPAVRQAAAEALKKIKGHEGTER